MKWRLHKRVIAAELVALLLPITLLELSLIWLLWHNPMWVVSMLGLSAIWYLAIGAIRYGPVEIAKGHLLAWAAAFVGGSAAAVTVLYTCALRQVCAEPNHWGIAFFEMLSLMWVPLLHLAAMALIARRANKSFERPPNGPVMPLAEQQARQSRGAAQLRR